MSKNGKSWEELTWPEKKEKHSIIAIIFLFLSICTLFTTPHPKLKELKTFNIILDEEPEFKESKGKSSSYWLEIYSGNVRYKLKGIDYKYLKEVTFKHFIHKDSLITISVLNDKIYEMEYRGEDLVNYNLAKIHKTKNRVFCQIIFFSGFILHILSLFFRKVPCYKNYYSEIVEFDFIKIFIICWFIAIIIAIIYLGDFKYISSSEFIKQANCNGFVHWI